MKRERVLEATAEIAKLVAEVEEPGADLRRRLIAQARVSGVNKPKRTPDHPTKSHVVVAQPIPKENTCGSN